MLAIELAQRRPKCPADYEQIARVLSPIFSSFPVKRRQSHAKLTFGDDGKPQTASSRLPFAVNAMLKVPNYLTIKSAILVQP